MNATTYYETLAGALNAAYELAVNCGAVIDITEWTRFVTEFGPVGYHETRRGSVLLFRYRGELNYTRSLHVNVYRMDSGRYEITAYIS